jgi:hypothetical protein
MAASLGGGCDTTATSIDISIHTLRQNLATPDCIVPFGGVSVQYFQSQASTHPGAAPSPLSGASATTCTGYHQTISETANGISANSSGVGQNGTTVIMQCTTNEPSQRQPGDIISHIWKKACMIDSRMKKKHKNSADTTRIRCWAPICHCAFHLNNSSQKKNTKDKPHESAIIGPAAFLHITHAAKLPC